MRVEKQILKICDNLRNLRTTLLSFAFFDAFALPGAPLAISKPGVTIRPTLAFSMTL